MYFGVLDAGGPFQGNAQQVMDLEEDELCKLSAVGPLDDRRVNTSVTRSLPPPGASPSFANTSTYVTPFRTGPASSGSIVGLDRVGAREGLIVGFAVGDVVGLAVGDVVGEAVGLLVGEAVGNALSGVPLATRNTIRASPHSSPSPVPSSAQARYTQWSCRRFRESRRRT